MPDEYMQVTAVDGTVRGISRAEAERVYREVSGSYLADDIEEILDRECSEEGLDPTKASLRTIGDIVSRYKSLREDDDSWEGYARQAIEEAMPRLREECKPDDGGNG